MDQIKIGRFIAERRKAMGFTQAALAERLGITDRAVSKWETGRALPDSSLMLELCGSMSVAELTRRLLIEDDILVKDLSSKISNGKQYLRVAVRNTADNDKLVKALCMHIK